MPSASLVSIGTAEPAPSYHTVVSPAEWCGMPVSWEEPTEMGIRQLYYRPTR